MSGPGHPFTVNGFSVRLAARRPDGKVLVEFLMPRSHEPMQSWAAKHLHEIKGIGLTIGRLKELVRVLPLVEFATDRPAPTPAPERPAPEQPATPEQPTPWWNRD